MKKINLQKFTLHILKHLPESERRITLATLVTLIRILLVPLIIKAMVAGWWGYAFFFFIFACFTDLMDGLLARLLNEKTFLGACLDPIADKLLLLSCFATLAFVSTPLFAVPRWFVFFVMSKEIIQLVSAFLIYYVRGHLNVQPTYLGKTTTCLQMIFIMWLFACYFFCWVPIKTYYTMLSIMIFFITISFMQYTRIGWGMLMSPQEDNL
ncbi:MAG TPA: CDP-alcohol phosphatidyltransferase family protein [Candidatus Babeliales bacterium]|jgi:cardiolipin synthase|nr:CDP-alcohol phosphatidyltransferase family protein [Candidatus Babeliales bacterium]